MTNTASDLSALPKTAPLSRAQIDALLDWKKAGGKESCSFLRGYPFGGAYVDARASKGSRTDGRDAFVKAQSVAVKACPHLRGLDCKEIVSVLRDRMREAGDFRLRDDEIFDLKIKAESIAAADRKDALAALVRILGKDLSSHEALELLTKAVA